MMNGARRLPLHHVTIRIPWHDGGWTGTVCTRPLDNSSCLILPRIGEDRRDDVEARCAGQRLDELDRADLPSCVSERVSFMAPFELGPEGTLIEIRDEPGGGLDAATIASVIDEVILG